MTQFPLPRTSIDLDAELRKITRRQHLNQVHYLVQLVRHALLCSPDRIVINNRGKAIEFAQNGDPFPTEELILLETILSEGGVSDDQRQQALSKLEKFYGVAMLSLILNSGEVEIRSAGYRVLAFEGRLHKEPHPGESRGYSLRFKRYAGTVPEETRELTYYCSAARTPILLNSKQINQSVQFDGQMIITRFENEDGYGAVGIPKEGDLCHLQLYKHGIRLGTKSFAARDGMLFHGFWDSKFNQFEAQYQRSILIGENHLFDHARIMYAALDQNFNRLAQVDRHRVRNLLLGIPRESWPDSLLDLPIFHGQQEDFAISTRDILNLHKRFQYVPFTHKPRHNAPADIPRLDAEELLHLRQLRSLECKLLRQPVKPLGLESIQPQKLTSMLPPVSTEPAITQLLEALNQKRSTTHFHIDKYTHGLFQTDDGKRFACLPVSHPFIFQAVHIFRTGPEKIGWIRYRFLAESNSHK